MKIIFLLISFCIVPLIAQADSVVNVYNWADYITAQDLQKFKDIHKISVNYDVFENNQILESKLLTGQSGYDIVGPSNAPYLENHIKMGLYQKIDKTKLKNYNNLDKDVLNLLSKNDVDNSYAIPWMWGTVGIAFNEELVRHIMPTTKMNSLDVIFNPLIVEKLSSCGVALIDDGVEVFPLVFKYLGMRPDTEDIKDFTIAESVLKKIRKNIRYFNNLRAINDLSSGKICVALMFSGDAYWAQKKAEELKNAIKIQYVLPVEGTYVWIDTFAVPKNAKNIDLAYKFLDFILEPNVAANTSNIMGYANANSASYKILAPKMQESIKEMKNHKHIFVLRAASSEFSTKIIRAWNKIVNSKGED